MKLPSEPPLIDSLPKAIAMGQALADVSHTDRNWAERVYQGDPRITFQAGPAVLNNELKSMWQHYMTNDERRRLLVAYASYLLGR